jgi:hypothetical protein
MKVKNDSVSAGIFGTKMGKAIGGWRKLHNEEIYNSYSSLHNQNDQVKEEEIGRACGKHGREEQCI